MCPPLCYHFLCYHTDIPLFFFPLFEEPVADASLSRQSIGDIFGKQDVAVGRRLRLLAEEQYINDLLALSPYFSYLVFSE